MKLNFNMATDLEKFVTFVKKSNDENTFKTEKKMNKTYSNLPCLHIVKAFNTSYSTV